MFFFNKNNFFFEKSLNSLSGEEVTWNHSKRDETEEITTEINKCGEKKGKEQK